MKINETAIVDHLRARLPGAMAIYLFGSVASGEAGPESDVDLAVLNDGALDPVALWDIAGELTGIVHRHVDLVDLRRASTVMQHQVVTGAGASSHATRRLAYMRRSFSARKPRSTSATRR